MTSVPSSRTPRPRDMLLRLLSVRARSVAEARTRLEVQGVGADVIDATIRQFLDSGLLNDEAFSRQLCEQTLRRKAVGPRFLQRALQRAGIHRELRERILSEVLPSSVEKASALRARVEYLRRHREGNDAKQAARLARFLASRGFSSGVIRETIEYD